GLSSELFMREERSSPFLDERAVSKLSHRLLQLLARVHHDRSVPRDRLFYRLSGDKQEANPLVARLDDYLIPRVEQDERAVRRRVRQDGRTARQLFRQNALRRGGAAEGARAGKHVRERVSRALDREPLGASRRHPDVQIPRVGRYTLDGSALAPELAADDANARSVVVDDFRDVLGGDVLIPRRSHFERRRQVRPQLKAVHASLRITARHLLM